MATVGVKGLTTHATVCVCHAELKSYLLTYLLTRGEMSWGKTSRGRTDKAHRTRPHRRHGSASEDQVASVANKQSDCLSLSRFPLKMLIDPDVTVLLSRLFQLLITRS